VGWEGGDGGEGRGVEGKRDGDGDEGRGRRWGMGGAYAVTGLEASRSGGVEAVSSAIAKS